MRYFFDVRGDGDFLRDEEGLEFPDLNAAIAEAAKSAASICGDPPVVRDGKQVTVSIRGEDGRAFADAVVSLQISRR
jgi:hypothetical protein